VQLKPAEPEDHCMTPAMPFGVAQSIGATKLSPLGGTTTVQNPGAAIHARRKCA